MSAAPTPAPTLTPSLTACPAGMTTDVFYARYGDCDVPSWMLYVPAYICLVGAVIITFVLGLQLAHQ